MTKTNSERQRAWRARNRDGRGRGIKHTKWSRAQFIALDGEGENHGEEEVFSTGEKNYRAQAHKYTLLAASTGESLFNGGDALDAQVCIDWLLDLGTDYPHAIFVIFAGSYDINHTLFGLNKSILEEIAEGHATEFYVGDICYQVEYRPRKSLALKRGKNWVVNSKGEHVVKWDSKITVWDVFGFFQENFVGVMSKWLGKDHKHFGLIKKMKALRGSFHDVPQHEINAYNAAELECLVELMEKVHGGLSGLDLKCMRWDGAGAIAAALMREHRVREAKQDFELPGLGEAIRTAYAGGRIELCKIGSHSGTVYDYDINSAYPSVQAHLPCLAGGTWRKGKEITSDYSLIKCRYDFIDDAPFYPLFFRSEHMQINFPQCGCGWYWYPEFKIASDWVREVGGTIEILEVWNFTPAVPFKPFNWIEHYYKTRQQWLKNPTEDWQRGGEKIIKLGLNSLYGKTAQQVGGRNGEAPAYHQLDWAGYITSATRARLFRAAATLPSAIIGFATDGIFSTEPLDIPLSETKEMGAWELKSPLPSGITVAMAGVYWWHYGDGSYAHYSRGFDKDAMKTPQNILAAWRAGRDELDIAMYRLIGMSSACRSEIFWQMRGRFVTSERTLALDGHSYKRNGIDIARTKPHLRLVPLTVSPNLVYEQGLQDCSHPYPIKWLDKDMDDEYTSDLELMAETGDTENI